LPQLEHIEAIEKQLWSAADNLRTNSNYDAIIRDTFKLISFTIPDNKIIEMFTDRITPILRQIDVLSTENRKLKKARDLPFPRLMNGEIAV